MSSELSFRETKHAVKHKVYQCRLKQKQKVLSSICGGDSAIFVGNFPDRMEAAVPVLAQFCNTPLEVFPGN